MFEVGPPFLDRRWRRSGLLLVTRAIVNPRRICSLHLISLSCLLNRSKMASTTDGEASRDYLRASQLVSRGTYSSLGRRSGQIRKGDAAMCHFFPSDNRSLRDDDFGGEGAWWQLMRHILLKTRTAIFFLAYCTRSLDCPVKTPMTAVLAPR